MRKRIRWGVEPRVWHASRFWRGCVRLDSGKLRVVRVFLSVSRLEDCCSDWEIDSRHVYEGEFEPTGKSARIYRGVGKEAVEVKPALASTSPGRL